MLDCWPGLNALFAAAIAAALLAAFNSWICAVALQNRVSAESFFLASLSHSEKCANIIRLKCNKDLCTCLSLPAACQSLCKEPPRMLQASAQPRCSCVFPACCSAALTSSGRTHFCMSLKMEVGLNTRSRAVFLELQRERLLTLH